MSFLIFKGDAFISEYHLLSNRIQYNIHSTRKYFEILNETWDKYNDLYSNYYLLLTKEQSIFTYPNKKNEEFIDLDMKTDESFNETITEPVQKNHIFSLKSI